MCEGKQNGGCNTVNGTKYKSNWEDERACMRQQSTGPTSGEWTSWLNVLDSESPADALNYTCVVENGLGKPQQQGTLLEIYGKLPFVCGR